MISLNVIRAAILGGAVADAVGVPAEFKSRKYLSEHPITDMVGNGTHNMPRGTFSDDTSMSLATLDSLAECGIDYDDAMQKFGAWWYKGEYTADGNTFDIGITTSTAIDNYFFYKRPALECGLSEESANGNGSLMRIHPVVLYCIANDVPDVESVNIIRNYSALTHAHERTLVGCIIFYFLLKELIKSPAKDSIQAGIDNSFEYIKDSSEAIYYERLLSGEIFTVDESAVKSSGYVVDSFEAALWSIMTTNDYRSAVLRAVNLGDDTDTVAAIAGVICAVLYGVDSIPKDWLDGLVRRDYVEILCEKAYDAFNR